MRCYTALPPLFWIIVIHCSNEKLVDISQCVMDWKCDIASFFFKSWLHKATWSFLTSFDISKFRIGSNFALLINSDTNFLWCRCLFSMIHFNTLKEVSYSESVLLFWSALVPSMNWTFFKTTEVISIIFITPMKNLQERVKSENEC